MKIVIKLLRIIFLIYNKIGCVNEEMEEMEVSGNFDENSNDDLLQDFEEEDMDAIMEPVDEQ